MDVSLRSDSYYSPWPCAGSVVGTYDCGAAVSAPLSFDAGRGRAYLACLDGSLHCLAVGPADSAATTSRAASGAASAAPAGRGSATGAVPSGRGAALSGATASGSCTQHVILTSCGGPGRAGLALSPPAIALKEHAPVLGPAAAPCSECHGGVGRDSARVPGASDVDGGTLAAGGPGGGSLGLRRLWRHMCGGPIFSVPAVAAGGVLVCAAVDGSLTGLSPSGACPKP
jgi:hypothetical protein